MPISSSVGGLPGPTVRSNFDVFRDIVDFKLARKQEILDWLTAQTGNSTDPQVIKQKWELLRAQYARLSQMDKDLTDIRQGIQSSSDGVLKNMVAGNATIQSAQIRARTEQMKVKSEALMQAQEVIDKRDEAGRASGGALADKATEAGRAFSAVAGEEAATLQTAIGDLWNTEYKGKYDALTSDVARKRFVAEFYKQSESMASIAARNAPGLMQNLKDSYSTVSDIARMASGVPQVTEADVQAAKDAETAAYQKQIEGLGASTRGGIQAPTLAQRLGVDPGSMLKVYKEAYLASQMLSHPGWFDSNGNPLEAHAAEWAAVQKSADEDPSLVMQYAQTTPQDEIVFDLNSGYVSKELERRQFAQGLDSEKAQLETPATPVKSKAQLEAEAVIEYNRMYGDKRQKALIAQYEAAHAATSAKEKPVNLSNDSTFSSMVTAALARQAAGKPITAHSMKNSLETIREEQAAKLAQAKADDLKALTDAEVTDLPEAPVENTPPVSPAVGAPGPQQKGGTPVKEMAVAPDADARQKVLKVYQDIAADTSLPVEERNVARRLAVMDVSGMNIPAGADEAATARAIAQQFYLYVNGNQKTNAGEKLAASKLLERVMQTGSFTSKPVETPTVEAIQQKLNAFEGKKYSELSDAEKSHVDAAAEDLVKLHTEVAKQAPSPTTLEALKTIGGLVGKVQAMDDVSDWEHPDVKAASEKGAAMMYDLGHAVKPEAPVEAVKALELPAQQKVKQAASVIGTGARLASEAYASSVLDDKPPAISGQLDSSRMDALKKVAGSPVKLYGKELDSALSKIAGDAWSVPSEKDKYRSLYAAYTLLG